MKHSEIKAQIDGEHSTVLAESEKRRSDTFMGFLRREQERRLRHLRSACANETLFMNQAYPGESKPRFDYSTKYNLSYCKVPKVGSSFWTQVFIVLRRGWAEGEKIFELPRASIHKNEGSLEGLTENILKSRSVIVARDPYSRLYSAYIDKMFLPLLYVVAEQAVRHQRGIAKNELMCPESITFQEFLNHIIKKVLVEGERVNSHWAPIFSLCNPCEINVLSLVKQESFSTDVEYILREIGLAEEEYTVIHDALHGRRIESTITGIVQTVLALTSTGRGCMNSTMIAERVWKSFQIQGYLRDGLPFPSDIIDTENKANNTKFLTEVILRTIKESPLTPDESKSQRRRALEAAYEYISEKTIMHIQAIYKQDFELFDYPLDPPSAKQIHVQ